MENWEAQGMKDDLTILEYELEGTRECELIKNTRSYINDLEKMLVKVAVDNRPRPIEKWHEDMGDCLFWVFPIQEPPYCGTPLSDDFKEGYYTHFTMLPIPEGVEK